MPMRKPSDPPLRLAARPARAERTEAHHFAALGFSATEALTATPASVQKAVEDFEKAVGASDGKPLYTTALGRVKARVQGGMTHSNDPLCEVTEACSIHFGC
eukprot:g13426.t1